MQCAYTGPQQTTRTVKRILGWYIKVIPGIIYVNWEEFDKRLLKVVGGQSWIVEFFWVQDDRAHEKYWAEKGDHESVTGWDERGGKDHRREHDK